MNNSLEMNITGNTAILDGFEKGLRDIGYPSGQIQAQYGYSNFLSGGKRQTVDIAAFGASVPSLRTCNIGVVINVAVTAEWLVNLRALGAPLLFTYDPLNTQLSRWKMPKEGLPNLLDEPLKVVPDRLPDYFDDHRGDWEPEAFRQARTAAYGEEVPQLDFFDVGLLPTIEDQLQRKLSNQIQRIAADSRLKLDTRDGEGTFERHFSDYARLLFRLLAAKLLSDRGDLTEMVYNMQAEQVLQVVEKKYNAKKSTDPVLNDPELRDNIWNALQSGLDLRNLSPETLAFVYENTLVDRDLRKRNGIHATPPHIADILLRQLPIDRLSERERVVFEPFCGNAPFLLAAMRRLRELLPVGRTSKEVHDYLVERLLGIEILPFASEIARYSLILGDYPNDNSWQIAEGNAFEDNRFEQYLNQSSIVLSNPPHENFPANSRPVGAEHNQAAEALRRVLQVPPLLLGFVMPLAFLDGGDYKMLRRQLAETYPCINVTALPSNVFGKAGQQTALIAAHRLDVKKRYFWAEVSSRDYSTTFPITGRPTSFDEKVSLPTDSGGYPVLWQRPQGKAEGIWDALSHHQKLSDLVSTVSVGIGHESHLKEITSQDLKEGYAGGLQTVKGASVEPYLATKIEFLNIRPEHLRRPNTLKYRWAAPKVIVTASRTGDLWRLLAVADDEALYASRRFWVLWPSTKLASPVSVEVLAAILNGPVANSFMAHKNMDRDNDQKYLKDIPVPSLTDTQVEEITSLVNAYKDIRWKYIEELVPWEDDIAKECRTALLKIDVAILEAYALPLDLETALLNQFKDISRRHLPFSFAGYSQIDWVNAKAELAAERNEKHISELFTTLLRKQSLYGLTPSEQEEYNRLQSLRTASRTQYRSLLETSQ